MLLPCDTDHQAQWGVESRPCAGEGRVRSGSVYCPSNPVCEGHSDRDARMCTHRHAHCSPGREDDGVKSHVEEMGPCEQTESSKGKVVSAEAFRELLLLPPGLRVSVKPSRGAGRGLIV